MSRTALLVIDPQNDYFEKGNFPLWNTDNTLKEILNAINAAKEQNAAIVLVQHVAAGESPFFVEGTEGVKLHQAILDAAPDAPVIIKKHADAFQETNLTQVLEELAVDRLVICGMMTQNCVTHTAISDAADLYQVSILPDACTTREQLLHLIALEAIKTKVTYTDIRHAFERV
ncbi:MAG: isochorismatase family protein [Gammaproteobacteria bacterium]|uniref:isochorismatase family protein n=1 Tax=Marinomonas TaxID=28253 RepID=UPI000C1DF993|nr:isochorismatase family protein [Marinomonas sp. BSi20584]MBU1295503.1 isochorismatase family protein [Gammaproteobacteria bacterium]MBU1469005.1 isochorismatase family protein [Gammaproteobacteria bacterium]MBU2023071.1 isochorismatase family protein [Gammaproteobacteria bacterium]MBU2238253.1 isochorismatase family protein [Gammaproteobacteria bacterium]MBU2318463.1 isochorismatase family protein [Gammaproteobacteria bacterium]